MVLQLIIEIDLNIHLLFLARFFSDVLFSK